jgi:hypothetical protein
MLSVFLAGAMILIIQYRVMDIFFFVMACFYCFLWFLHKTSSVVFVRSCARKKHENVVEHTFITFLGSTRLYEKGTPLESSLSSFQTL